MAFHRRHRPGLAVGPRLVVLSTPIDALVECLDALLLRIDRSVQMLRGVGGGRLDKLGGFASGFGFGEFLLSDGRTDRHRFAAPLALPRHVLVKAYMPRLALPNDLSTLA